MQIKITDNDLKTIIGDNYETFENKILSSCYCVSCRQGSSKIFNYEIFLNDSGDIVLKGRCKNCRRPMDRYAETGGNEDYVTRIQKIREKYAD